MIDDHDYKIIHQIMYEIWDNIRRDLPAPSRIIQTRNQLQIHYGNQAHTDDLVSPCDKYSIIFLIFDIKVTGSLFKSVTELSEAQPSLPGLYQTSNDIVDYFDDIVDYFCVSLCDPNSLDLAHEALARMLKVWINGTTE